MQNLVINQMSEVLNVLNSKFSESGISKMILGKTVAIEKNELLENKKKLLENTLYDYEDIFPDLDTMKEIEQLIDNLIDIEEFTEEDMHELILMYMMDINYLKTKIEYLSEESIEYICQNTEEYFEWNYGEMELFIELSFHKMNDDSRRFMSYYKEGFSQSFLYKYGEDF